MIINTNIDDRVPVLYVAAYVGPWAYIITIAVCGQWWTNEHAQRMICEMRRKHVNFKFMSNSTLLIAGSIHWGYEVRFTFISRGRQCSFMMFSAMFKMTYVASLSSSTYLYMTHNKIDLWRQISCSLLVEHYPTCAWTCLAWRNIAMISPITVTPISRSISWNI